MHLLSHLLGLDNASGPLYLFWSGFFGDVTILAGITLFFYKHVCHIEGCYRLAKHHTQFCAKHQGREV